MDKRRNKKTEQGNPYYNLANAIIIVTVEDFRYYSKRLLKNPSNTQAIHIVNECTEFFQSQWFELLTNISGTELLEKLRREINGLYQS